MKKEIKMPDYLFEVSWEVCNKVGGIHTVLATKALNLNEEFQDRHIHIGPDVWMHTRQNPEFIPDPTLFKTWRELAAHEGLRVQVGRWNIPGNPVAILVDFKTFITSKDQIFAKAWEQYGVDSLNGNWEYIEAFLFGYAAGKVIESFSHFYIRSSSKIVAQFHEWMAGAGVLYLKSSGLPIGTVFTTHATVVGRCMASKHIPFYKELPTMNGDTMARDYGVSDRHSVEKAAALNADVFTTVSDLTANECKILLGREPDVVTPNGIDASYAPDRKSFAKMRVEARKSLLKVATAMSDKQYDDAKTEIVWIGGRYEYETKGINVFIDALAKVERSNPAKKVAAFIMVPSGNNGPDKDLVEKLANPEHKHTTNVTHYLIDDFDCVRRHLSEVGLDNAPERKVDVYFVPSYLNGNDGIFNKSYMSLLTGADLTLFPSYYEPWGYTPLESLAYNVPTVTTTLAGFGLWIKERYSGKEPLRGVTIVDRDDFNYGEVVDSVAGCIERYCAMSPEEYAACAANAKEISFLALWENNISFYKTAYDMAIDKVIEKFGPYPLLQEDNDQSYRKQIANRPNWNSIVVNRSLPSGLSGLEDISRNLWWCWNDDAINLFSSIDPTLWEESKGNPIVMLDNISLEQYKTLEQDKDFMARLKSVHDHFTEYMKGKAQRKSPKIAYFCMEYGLDTSLKIYSGGLGILAGDYLKEASDMGVNLTAVGLLYKYGYFTQYLSGDGDQVASYDPQNFRESPAQPVLDKDGKWLTVSVPMPGRNLNIRIWKVEVGRTDLYLLDTDFEENMPEDRPITHQLYGGDWENRLKQEILLGLGGIRALKALGIQAEVYHCNEGHAAFTGIERIRMYVENDNLSFAEALEVVRSSSLFTTHTPVPAGHDFFSEDMMRVYFGSFPARMKIDWHTFMGLGRYNINDGGEKFSMSVLAANMSQGINGVSWLHGKVSQEILAGMWPGYLPEEVNVGYVTNGVHYPTWTAPAWKAIHARVFGKEFATHHYDKSCFSGIYKIPDKEIWNVRSVLRKRLIDYVKKTISDTKSTAHYSPSQIVKIKSTLRNDVLTIGFARRFATYKRATLLFRNLDRLDKLVNNPDRPVQFLFAGKAHPADKAGSDFIKQIVEISKMPQFIGKIVFVPNYDITVAKLLVQGVDIWMNNPTRRQEASGTSGEKAVMNGVMHFSVLDGWWVEGYKEGAGWALPLERTYEKQEFQDDLDSAMIYSIISNDIAPAFYKKDWDKDYSPEWIKYIKNTIAQVACNFTTNRMMEDYLEKYYRPQAARYKKMIDKDFLKAREIAQWKKHMYRAWPGIEIRRFDDLNGSAVRFALGDKHFAEAEVFLPGLTPDEIGIECVITEQDSKGAYHIREVHPYEVVSFEDCVATYRADITPVKVGTYQYATRMFAKSPELAHRQDFELVKWL